MFKLLEIDCYVNAQHPAKGWINPYSISYARPTMRRNAEDDLVECVLIEFIEGTSAIVSPETWAAILETMPVDKVRV